MTTRTRIHRTNGGAAGGIGERGGGAGEGELAVFEGLAHDFEHFALELGQLVEEENAVMSEADLAGPGDRATADEAGIGDRVVRRAERASGDQRLVGGEETAD